MAKRNEVPKTDPSDIESLIQRLKHSNINRKSRCFMTRVRANAAGIPISRRARVAVGDFVSSLASSEPRGVN